MTTVSEVVYRLRRVPPRRLPVVVGRYAVRVARTRTRRWRIEHNRGELSDGHLRRALGRTSAEQAFSGFVRRFFVDPTAARNTASALAATHPALAERTRVAAEQAVAHVVDLLGSGPVQLGQRIDWHRDFKVDIGWPNTTLADDLNGLRLAEPCDVKVPWELSRCHHWVTLGRAYALQPDPRYAREFVSQLTAWLDDNPWPYGVNWSRAMEVAVRAVNWLWAAALFAEAPEFSAPLRTRFLKALLQHGNHILDNLEYADNNGNHYLSNGVGLVFLSILLSDFQQAAAWRKKGFEIVWGEMVHQVYPDGVDFEQGIGYHGLVAEFWYSCVLLCDRNAIPVPRLVRERLGRMFAFMLAYTRPDGTFPQIGDNDDGRLANLDDEPVGSHRRHLAVGGVLFSRPDLLGAAGDAIETAAWLCGPQVLDLPRAVVEQSSQAFAKGGFYIMRAPDAVMVIDAGDIGMRGIGGHGHNDVLSFDLWAAGCSVLVDPGTFTYSADPAARNLLRSTAAHNSLRVDAQETSRLGADRWLWLIENDAHPNVGAWKSDAAGDLFEGSHDGYTRLPEPVEHTRRITFDKAVSWWRIDDTLTGRGEHLCELFFHPGVPVEVEEGGVRLRARHADVWLLPPPEATFSQVGGWISRGYGLREPATVLVYSVRSTMPLRLRTDLVRVPSGTPVAVARSLVDRA
ncbi:MAG: heparinase II/III domain-containing protein [Chloroflexota bacterium]